MMPRLPGLLVALCVALGPVAAQGARADLAAEAVDFVAASGGEMIEILDLPAGDERRDRFHAWLADAFDLDTVGQLALGPYRSSASEAQIEAYECAFTRYIVTTYEARFDDFAGYTFEVARARPMSDTDAVVRATVIAPSGRKTPVDFRVRRDGGAMHMIDVAIEGLSMLKTQRDEFASVIQKNGLDGLIERLRSHADAAAGN